MDLLDAGSAWLVDIDAASFVCLRPSPTQSLPYCTSSSAVDSTNGGHIFEPSSTEYETTWLLPSVSAGQAALAGSSNNGLAAAEAILQWTVKSKASKPTGRRCLPIANLALMVASSLWRNV